MFLFHNDKSIRLYPNGFSLLKKSTGNNAIVKDYPDTPISNLVEYAAPFFNFDQKKTEKVTIVSNITIPLLIPKEIYDENAAHDYLKMQFNISDIGAILADEIGEYISLYYFDTKTINTIKKLNIDFFHVHQSTLVHFYTHNTPSLLYSEHMLYIHTGDTFIDILVEKNRQIFLINRFSFSTEYDILYHCFNILKQCHIDSSMVHILLLNNNNKNLMELLKQYFPHFTPIR